MSVNPSTSPVSQPSTLQPSSPSPDPTPEPTPEPSFPPSASPTEEPTEEPTMYPTGSPSAEPTVNPTPNPSYSPTLEPTPGPTPSPSEAPSTSPTFPTQSPESPTMSGGPTPSPTAPTTRKPTSPTAAPTTKPTRVPTPAPTVRPTKAPTPKPTFAPTRKPTRQPTAPTAPTAPTTHAPSTDSPTPSPTRSPVSGSPTTKSPTSRSPTTKGPTIKGSVPSPTMQWIDTQVTVNATEGGQWTGTDLAVVFPPDVVWNDGYVQVSLQPPDLFVIDNPTNTGGTVVTAVVSLTYNDPVNGPADHVNLASPFNFQVRITEDGAKSIAAAGERCEGEDKVTTPLSPQCMWFNTTSHLWDGSGCSNVPAAIGFIGCSCNHLTDFAAILPSYNPLPAHPLMVLNSEGIEAHPGGIVSLCCVYIIFLALLAYGIRWDRNDTTNVDRRKSKEAKWANRLSRGEKQSFWSSYKGAMQRKHTIFSLLSRKKGSSFRSVDRVCVTMIAVLTCMATTAHFHGQNQHWIGFVLVIFFSALASCLPYLILEMMFTRIGARGYKDDFDLTHGVRPIPGGKCCRCWMTYRLPEWSRMVVYAIIGTLGIVLSWYILVMALEFDLNEGFICSGNASSSWIVHFLFSIALNIFVIQPFKIFLVCAFTYKLQRTPKLTKSISLDDVRG